MQVTNRAHLTVMHNGRTRTYEEGEARAEASSVLPLHEVLSGKKGYTSMEVFNIDGVKTQGCIGDIVVKFTSGQYMCMDERYFTDLFKEV